MQPKRILMSGRWPAIKFIILIALVSVGVLLMILYGFPLIEDLLKGRDPAERYQSEPEAEFVEQVEETVEKDSSAQEMYLTDLKFKNDSYIFGDKIIFTTRVGTGSSYRLDAVAIYNTITGEAEVLPNVEKKYDNLLSPVMNGNVAVWVDSLVDGGGRIVGYDLQKQEQFLIKEYGYAVPALSLADDMLTFMQWAGDTTQRLYVYNVNTREAATVRLYETKLGNSSADISRHDLVWSEYGEEDIGVSATLKRIVFNGEGKAQYDNYELRMNVFEPKTNGKDIVFATRRDILSGDLMLSTGGSEPIKIAENVLNYDIGDNFVAYTKDDKIYICYTDRQEVLELTSDITKNILVSVNGNGLTFYDVTDGVSVDEVVMYTYIN